MTRGRKRRHNPNIPAHIDQTKLPGSVYYDHRGNGCWYILTTDEGDNRRRNNIAGSKALLSDLHRIIEDRAGVARGTLQWLSDEFQKSEKFKELTPNTRRDYEIHAAALCEFATKAGPLGALLVDRFSVPLVQRVIDKIAGGGTPTKAIHCLQYLRRLLNWGKNRGHCAFVLPTRTVETPKERQRRRLPEPAIMAKLIAFAQERGPLKRGEKGAVAPYLWAFMEVAYLCRLRGVEVMTLTDANTTDQGVLTNRTKGSRDNVVRWNTRLRAAIDAAVARRAEIWGKKKMPVPITADRRLIFVAAHGGALQKSSIDTAFQRLVQQALDAKVITADQRFGLHDLKRRGVTDTPGTRADKQEASGHRAESMLDVYDLSVPVVDPSAQ